MSTLMEHLTRNRGVISHRDAIAAGILSKELSRAVNDGELRRTRRGAYVDAALWADSTDHERYLLDQRAILADRQRNLAAAFGALFMRGLPVYAHPHNQFWVEAPVQQSRCRAGLHIAPFARSYSRDVFSVGAIPPARAIVQVAALGHSVTAIAAGDYALRHGTVTKGQLAREAMEFRCEKRVGYALEHMEPSAESVIESVARVHMRDAGLRVTPQFQVTGPDGPSWRVDFIVSLPEDPERILVVELNGLCTYGDEAAADVAALIAAKQREAGLRALGFGVFRATSSDLSDPPTFIADIKHALHHTVAKH